MKTNNETEVLTRAETIRSNMDELKRHIEYMNMVYSKTFWNFKHGLTPLRNLTKVECEINQLKRRYFLLSAEYWKEKRERG